jgi:hypothetical protein
MLAATLGLVLVAGCAGYRITPGGNGSGYDVYRPAPYILVTPMTARGQDGTVTTTHEGSIVWLPDYSARYRVKSWNHFGKADFEFKFQDGWMLTSISDKSDNTEPAKTLISAAKDIALQAAKAGVKAPPGAAPPETPMLFKITYSSAGYVTGLMRVPDATASMSEPPAPSKSFEWPGLTGLFGWLFGFGEDSY